ncbi:ERBB-3 BINDING PROTEIN [Trifolium repens]|nr:ERBB-3 BINDING PROTEIN [Trifolium repens]
MVFIFLVLHLCSSSSFVFVIESYFTCIFVVALLVVANLRRWKYVPFSARYCLRTKASVIQQVRSISDGERDEKELDLSSSEVVTKYKIAAEIINRMFLVISECKPKAKIVDICEKGDSFITEQTSNVYKNAKKIERIVAFPTCISVNSTICHFSPLASDETVLEEGDIVKM